MSRVTIRELLYECNQSMSPDDFIKMQKILDIEIIPRRAIEMILEKCRQDIIKYNHDSEEAACIEQYTESLLKQFEGDKE